MPLHYLLAEYEDGFQLVEDDADVSPYDEGRNIFHAILNKRPESEHGRLVRLSLVGPEYTYSIDWTTLPDNARPIRFKHMEREFATDGSWVGEATIVSIDFGYQYTDDEGRNVQEVREVR